MGAGSAPRVGSKTWREGVLVNQATYNIDDAGCSRMWAAVVYQAVKDMTCEDNRRPAMNWMYSDDSGPGSMRWICDMLDLDYHKLTQLCMTRSGRAKILRWSPDIDGKRSPRSMK